MRRPPDDLTDTFAVNAALETACPVIGAFVHMLFEEFENGPFVEWRPLDVDLLAVAASRSTPDVERRRGLILAEHAVTSMSIAMYYGRQRRSAKVVADAMWDVSMATLQTMLAVTP